MTAVEFQYWLPPIALTTLATQAGPVSVFPNPAWSEFALLGETHETAGSVPFETSVRKFVSGIEIFVFHSGPLRTALIASKGFQ